MTPPASQKDPIDWCAVIALGFFALCLHRLSTPPGIYFDEIHYVPAARKLLDLIRQNPEHPMVGKEIIAASIAIWGDKPMAWRMPSAIFGALGLFAFGRLIWWASLRRFATVSAMLLLGTGFAWFIQSRIAMLDMFMAGFAIIAFWQFAAALQQSARRARLHLGLCGLCLGLAIGSKWSVAPAAMLPGLAVLALRFRDHGRNCLLAKDSRPLPGISLVEAGLWLGLLPLVVYWASFAPVWFLKDHPVKWWDIAGYHRYMFDLQDSVRKPHPYKSYWYQWIINWRAIWYLYEPVHGVQRGILLVGNPFTMLAGLPALAWCLWAGIRARRNDALAMAALYGASIGLWVVSHKPVQFYYHYLLPGTFLLGCLALALDALWQRQGRERWLAPAALALSCAMFAHFYPIISAGALHNGKQSYVEWMWLHSWR